MLTTILTQMPDHRDGDILEAGHLSDGVAYGWEFRIVFDPEFRPPVRVEVCDTGHGFDHWVIDHSQRILLDVIWREHLQTEDILSDMLEETGADETGEMGEPLGLVS